MSSFSRLLALGVAALSAASVSCTPTTKMVYEFENVSFSKTRPLSSHATSLNIWDLPDQTISETALGALL